MAPIFHLEGTTNRPVPNGPKPKLQRTRKDTNRHCSRYRWLFSLLLLLFIILFQWRYLFVVLTRIQNNHDFYSSIMDSPIIPNHTVRTKEDFIKAYHRLMNLPKDSTRRVAFVTFSHVKEEDDDAEKLFQFLLPAVDTWAAPLAREESSFSSSSSSYGYEIMLYVVLSHQSQRPFETHCNAYKNNKLCSRLRPIYVNCPEGKRGTGPCCKQQEGLRTLFEGKEYPLYDWYGFFDDDVYLRKEYVVKNLQLFEPHFPMALTSRSNDAKYLGHLDNTCHERGPQFQYPWGMPIFYSRGAMHHLSKGLRANGLVKQCNAFRVSHDVGNAIFHWMHSLRIAKLPPMASLPKVRSDYIGSHWVGRSDMEETYHLQPRDRNKPKLQPLPKGSFSFYETHKLWTSSPELAKPPEMHQLFATMERRWYTNVTGYRQTLTYARHREPTSWPEGVWHTMEVEDCNPMKRKEKLQGL